MSSLREEVIHILENPSVSAYDVTDLVTTAKRIFAAVADAIGKLKNPSLDARAREGFNPELGQANAAEKMKQDILALLGGE